MDSEQTRAKQDRLFEMLMANSSPDEQRRLLAARNDRSLRDAVEQLTLPNDRQLFCRGLYDELLR